MSVRHFTYNDFDFTLFSSEATQLVVRQAYDVYWHVLIDGRPINAISADRGLAISVPISSGEHTISMSYRPWSRALYWPCSLLLIGNLIVIWIYGYRQGKAPSPSISKGP